MVKKQATQRNASLELLRLCCCLCVIIHHTGRALGSEYEMPNAMLMSVVCSAVPVFLSLTGCFWFRKDKGFLSVVKRFLTGVLLPMAASVVMIKLLEGWITSPSLPVRPEQLAMPDWGRLLRGFLKMYNVLLDPYALQLWYVFTLAAMVVWYPVLQALVRSWSEKELGIFLLCMEGALVLQAAAVLFPETVTMWIPAGVATLPLYACELLTGHLLYARRKQLSKGWMSAAGLVLFLMICYLRFFLTKRSGLLNTNVDFYGNDNLLVLPMIVSVYMIFLPLRIPERAGKVICTVSSFSYGVFLIHPAVMEKMAQLKLYGSPVAELCKRMSGSPALNLAAYSLLTAVSVYAASVLLLLPWRGMRLLWQRVRKGGGQA